MFTMKAICSTTLLEMLLGGGGGSKNHHHQQSRISKRRKREEKRDGEKVRASPFFYPSLLVFNISKLTPFYTIRIVTNSFVKSRMP